MEKAIKDRSDEEIEEILRRAENTTTSGSLYQQAFSEWQIRNQKALLKEQGEGNRELVRATKLVAYATIALVVITTVILYLEP